MSTPPAPGAIGALPAAAEAEPAPVPAVALPRRRMNLLPRVASSAVLVVLVAGMIYVGGIPLDVLIGAAAALGAWELASLVARCPVPAPRWLLVALAVWLAERAVLPGAGGNLDVILPFALPRGNARLVRDELIPRSQFEEPAHGGAGADNALKGEPAAQFLAQGLVLSF